MKEISIITSYPLCDEPVIKNRLLPFIFEFGKLGYSINIFQPKGELYNFESVDAKQIMLDKPKIVSGSFIKRAFLELKLAFQLLVKYKKVSCSSDIAFITMPSMFLLLLLPFVKCNIKILDVRDLTWEYLKDNNITHYFFKRFYRLLFWHLSRFSDYITVSNKFELSHLESIGFKKKTKLISNGISIEQFEKMVLIQEKDSTEDLVISYIGNVGLAQDLSFMVELAESHPNFKFNIVGGGNDLERIRSLVLERNLNNIVLTGRLSWEQVLGIYEQTDVLFAQLTEEFQTAIPSKLYEYLASGKRVIYGGDIKLESFFSDFSGIEFIEPKNQEMFDLAIIKIFNGQSTIDANLNRNLIHKNFIRESAVRKFVCEIGLK
ncbi:glycosyltransferase [Vibrio vulnificus]|nr:glycosyltransferase [Vibrio vulnificus]